MIPTEGVEIAKVELLSDEQFIEQYLPDEESREGFAILKQIASGELSPRQAVVRLMAIGA